MENFLLFVLLALFSNSIYGWGDSILLKDIGALTFYEGQVTNSRRTSPIPQLRCVGGSAGCYTSVTPKVVQCKNSGSDENGDVQWICNAELQNGYDLGRVSVNCEGYSGPNDKYVLRGSCSLSYNLDRSSPHFNRNTGTSGASDSVLKSSITELTFYKGQKTKSRHGSYRMQLHCTGGSGGCSEHLEPKFIKCNRVNSGSSRNGEKWNCNGTFPSGYRIGNASVVCEGYKYPDDDYIVAGSCSLDYTIESISFLSSLLRKTGLDNIWSTEPKMLLENVKTLTFKSTEMTAARRSTSIPQLRCVYGCTQFNQPREVTCTNRGTSGDGNVQWSCVGDVGNGYHFGRVNVNCEGYNSRDDKYVLQDSCGLEYTLERN